MELCNVEAVKSSKKRVHHPGVALLTGNNQVWKHCILRKALGMDKSGEEPSLGNDFGLESARGWKRPWVAKDLPLENAQNNFDKPVVGNKAGSGNRFHLDRALG